MSAQKNFTFQGSLFYSPQTGHATNFSWYGIGEGFVRPETITKTTFGTPSVSLQSLRINAEGERHAQFGVQLVKLSYRYVVASGERQTAFGRPLIYRKIQELYALGEALTKFGDGIVSNKLRSIYAYHTGDEGEAKFGTPTLTHTRITGVTLGVATRFGIAKVSPPWQIVYANSLHDKQFGTQTAVTHYNQMLFPAGGAQTVFGVVSMSPLYLRPVGTNYVKFGEVRVSGTRITGVGLGLRTRFGTAYVSNLIYIYPFGNQHTKFGAPPYGVMHTSTRTLGPSGISGGRFGREDWDYRVGTYLWETDFVREPDIPTTRFGNADVQL